MAAKNCNHAIKPKIFNPLSTKTVKRGKNRKKKINENRKKMKRTCRSPEMTPDPRITEVDEVVFTGKTNQNVNVCVV